MLVVLLNLIFNAHASFLQMPEKCFSKKQFPCTIQTQGKSKITLIDSEFYFSNNSLIEMRSAKEIFMARGVVWGIAKSDFLFKSTYGRFQSAENGAEFWLSIGSEHTVKVVAGEMEVTPRGGESHFVSMGKQINVSSVDYLSSACYTSHVTVFDFSEYLRSYGKVFPFGKLSVEDHLYKVARAVLTASTIESQSLKKQAARQLASDLEKDVRLKAQKEAATKLEIYLRRLYKSKSNYEDQ